MTSPSILLPKAVSAPARALASVDTNPSTRVISVPRSVISLAKPVRFNSICSMVDRTPSLPSSKPALKVLILSCKAFALDSNVPIKSAWASCLSCRS